MRLEARASQRAIVTFCWLPPDSRRTCARGTRVDLQRLDRVAHAAALVAHVDRPPAAEAVVTRRRDVLAHRPLRQERVQPVGRNEDDARRGSRRTGGGPSAASRRRASRPPSACRSPASTVEQLVLALALERRDAEDLAGAQRERDAVRGRPTGGSSTSSADRASSALGRRPRPRRRPSRSAASAAALRRLGPEHVLDDLLLAALLRHDRRDRTAVAQDRRAVADLRSPR